MTKLNRSLASVLGRQIKACTHAQACETCAVHDRAVCSALSKDELAGLNKISRRRRLKPGQRILSDQEQTESFAIIVSGSVKLSKSLPDGRQQIVGLLFPSDFVGRPFAKRGTYHAEAATEVQLCSFPSAPFERLILEHPGVEHRLFEHALDQLDVSQDWMLLLGRKTALEKVASLLLMISDRALGSTDETSKPRAPAHFEMPLSRSDTADYLGLTLETVSRQFRILKSTGIIRLSGTRNVTILDRPRLEAAATSPVT
jgi:CRP/FNR family transcriptional regulator